MINIDTTSGDCALDELTDGDCMPLVAPVAIVGGGHVGLSFALLLSHYGIACILIEKNSYPSAPPSADKARNQHYLDVRNTALSRKTVQIYQKIGLWDRLQSHACRIDTVRIFEKNSFGHATLRKHEEKVESFGQVIENAHLGHTLLSAIKADDNIHLMDGVALVDIAEEDGCVYITLDNGQKIQSRLLVACDGQHSKARQLLGITDSTYDYHQTGIVAVVTTELPHEHSAIECFSSYGPLALLPLTDDDGTGNEPQQKGHRRSVVWICPKGQEKQYLENDDYFLQALNETFAGVSGRITQTGRRGAYPLMKMLAHKQTVGRCVIMGNAAHTLHPVAGQGFNLCMRDALYLAQLLSENHKAGKDLADKQTLSHYEKARLTDQKRVILFCDLVIGSFTHPNFVLKIARNLGLIIFDKLPGIKPLVARFAMGLNSTKKLDEQQRD